MAERPDLCPRCGASTTAHTGTYCQECGEPLTKDEKPLPRRATFCARCGAAPKEHPRPDCPEFKERLSPAPGTG